MFSDCSRAGDFRSITSLHFRGKRSLDQSYPGDDNLEEVALGDEPDNNQIFPPDKIMPAKNMGSDAPEFKKDMPAFTKEMPSNHDRPPRNSGPSDIQEKGSHADMMAEMYKTTGRMMDQVDVRIEGMEEMMGELHKTVRKMTRKVICVCLLVIHTSTVPLYTFVHSIHSTYNQYKYLLFL